jgi:periplasmic protein TonB
VDGHMFAPRRIPPTITMVAQPEPPMSDLQSIPGAALSNGNNPAAIFSGHNDHPAVVQGPPKGPTIISRGVAEGMLLQRVVPRYPPIAQASHTQGTVVLQAVIAKNGVIENLRVLSGSPMLTQAALDAVSQWRYRPYLLNGEPVAVETTINVVFRLGQ